MCLRRTARVKAPARQGRKKQKEQHPRREHTPGPIAGGKGRPADVQMAETGRTEVSGWRGTVKTFDTASEYTDLKNSHEPSCLSTTSFNILERTREIKSSRKQKYINIQGKWTWPSRRSGRKSLRRSKTSHEKAATRLATSLQARGPVTGPHQCPCHSWGSEGQTGP